MSAWFQFGLIQSTSHSNVLRTGKCCDTRHADNMAALAWSNSGGNLMMREGNQKGDPGFWGTHIFWGMLGSPVESLWHTHTAAGLLDSCGSAPPLLSSHPLIVLLTWGFFWQTLLELPVLTRKPSWPMFLASTTPSQEPRRYRRIPSSLHRAHLVPLLMSKPFFLSLSPL